MAAGVLAKTGATLSFTVMVWDEVAVFPQISVAVQVRTIEYLLAQVPGVMASATVIETVPVQLSEAVTGATVATGTSAAQA
jgi:hypothetical protein